MARYIRGRTKPAIAKREDEPDVVYTGVTGFIHIRKGGTKKGTLCGTQIESPIELLAKRPETDSDICSTCKRVEAGKDPVFDRMS